MDTAVFLAVLGAAVMHAGWNAIVKVGLDRFSSILLLSMVQGVMALVLLPFFAAPLAAAWPWVAASALLHIGYKLFLIRAYEHGDLSQVYPLARGTAPLIVALVGAIWLGESMTAGKTAAVAAIALGVIVMSRSGAASTACRARRCSMRWGRPVLPPPTPWSTASARGSPRPHRAMSCGCSPAMRWA